MDARRSDVTSTEKALMFASKRPSRPIAATAVSFILALGAVAVAPVASANAADMPRFSIHVDAPRVTTDTTYSIERGMSRSDVVGILGEPARTGRFALSKTVAWDYDFRDDWGYEATFSVIFNEAGTVVGKASVRTGD
jgi:outer membrane protein assembly factor BamE (lipoprotein component of BamABCDE complex)